MKACPLADPTHCNGEHCDCPEMTERVNSTPISGFMWCTEHDDVADECIDGSRCCAALYGREPRNPGTDCALVPLYALVAS